MVQQAGDDAIGIQSPKIGFIAPLDGPASTIDSTLLSIKDLRTKTIWIRDELEPK